MYISILFPYGNFEKVYAELLSKVDDTKVKTYQEYIDEANPISKEIHDFFNLKLKKDAINTETSQELFLMCGERWRVV